MKNISCKKTFFGICYFYKLPVYSIILFLFAIPSFALESKVIEPPFTGNPIAVSVGLYINKIFNIDTVNESFQIDGYLVLSWTDKRMEYDREKAIYGPIAYVNDKARTIINDEIWFPPFKFVNILEKPENHNQFLVITPGGKIYYTERFTGLFYSENDYTKFPFDSQCFNIVLETFLYDKRYMEFAEPVLEPEFEASKSLLDKWKIENMGVHINESSYNHLDDNAASTYSKVVFQVNAKRLSGYYVWRVLFPLVIIIIASFVVFWFDDFGDQLNIGFTLMLTVVAFNFFSSSILPKLPYITFIESVIMVGYVFIFLSILAVTANNIVIRNKKKVRIVNKLNLLKLFRILFPVIFTVTMLILSLPLFL